MLRTLSCSATHNISTHSIPTLSYEECRVGFDSQNQSFIETEQPPDGSIPEITAGVAESALLDNKKPNENALFCSINETLQSLFPGYHFTGVNSPE